MEKVESATARQLPLLKKLSHWYLENPVLVYTMGKVGSSTIVETLRELGFSEVQPHSLTLSRRGSYFVLPERKGLKNLKDRIKSKLLKTKGKLYLFSKRITKKRIKIVTLSRDPIARTISAYFEQYKYVLDKDINSVNTQELIENFFKFANHDTPHIWFDNEIKRVLKLDIYASDFDKILGWKLIETEDFDLIIIKMEYLSTLTKPLSKFFNVSSFPLKPANRSDFKEYKKAYDKFKQEITFTKEYLDFHYESKYTNYFYTQDEIDGFRKKWTKRVI